jgi:hypothetical protein
MDSIEAEDSAVAVVVAAALDQEQEARFAEHPVLEQGPGWPLQAQPAQPVSEANKSQAQLRAM